MRPDEFLRGYVSPLLLRRLAEGTPIEPPEARTLSAAVATIDVQGFSPLSEKLSRRGPAGIEELASLINRCFGGLVDTVHAYGGVAHTFPGDAVIAVWPASPSHLAEATHRAAACARELTASVGRAPGSLPLKAGIGAGSVTTLHAGGVADRRELLVTGEALEQMAGAIGQARRGEVVLSEPAWRLLGPAASAAERGDGVVVLDSLSPAAKVPPAPPSSISLADQAVLRGYLPDGLLAQLESGQADWLGEFRRLSVVFAWMGARPGGPALTAEVIHRGFSMYEEALYRYEGGVVQLCHDDKGLVIVGATGLPGLVHEDDTERALLAALSIQSEFEELGIDFGIGVATGKTFCGALGNRTRREYSVVGSIVNLSARLMEHGRGAVLCDAATRAAAGHRIEFDEALVLDLKGFERPVPSFRARLASPTRTIRGDEVSRVRPRIGEEKHAIIGRDTERAQLGDWLDAVARGHESALAIRGEPGIGKSFLRKDLVHRGRDAGMEVFVGFCDTLNAALAYQPWRSIFERVLHLAGVEEDAGRSARVTERVAEVMGDTELAPLLAGVLHLKLPESLATSQMAGAVRRDNTLALLSALIRDAARRYRDEGSALLIVIEDAHLMDSASWALLDLLRRSRGDLPIGLAVCMRTMANLETPSSKAFLDAEETKMLDLEALSQDAAAELIKSDLRAETVDRDLMILISRRAQGNPFFCAELVAGMKEKELIRVERGVARAVDRGGLPAESMVPDSVSGVLESRIDRLAAPLQLTLKVASVIGQRIDSELLRSVHPVELPADLVERQLEELTELGLLRRDRHERYFFSSAITRDVAYNGMLFSQRRQLHRATAEHLEASDDGVVASGILFHHWRESGEVSRALDYVDATGADAMHQGNYQEAIELFEYGLGCCEDAGLETEVRPASPEEIGMQVRWSHQLGEAQVAVGRHALGRHSLETGLQGLRRPVPSRAVGVTTAIARELGRQLVHRALPRRAIAVRRTPESHLVTAAEAYEQLGYIYYASGETLLGVHAALKMLNLAERSAVSPVLARSYASMGLTVSVVPLRRMALLYERSAQRSAEELGDPLTRAWVGWISSLRAAGEGRWESVESQAGSALELAEQLGDSRLQLMSLQTLASAALLQGDVERAVASSQAQLAIANEQGNRLWEVWALNSHSEATLIMGDDEATVARCQRALDILVEESDRIDEIRASGMLAVALLRLGRTGEALTTAQRIGSLIDTTDLTSFAAYEGFAGACEVLLGMAENVTRRGGVMPPTLAKDTQRACAALRKFARIFPIGRPRYYVAQARLLALRGKRRAAVRALERAVTQAETLRMPHEQGLALLALERCDWLPQEQRRRSLERAHEVLCDGVARQQAEQRLAESRE